MITFLEFVSVKSSVKLKVYESLLLAYCTWCVFWENLRDVDIYSPLLQLRRVFSKPVSVCANCVSLLAVLCSGIVTAGCHWCGTICGHEEGMGTSSKWRLP